MVVVVAVELCWPLRSLRWPLPSPFDACHRHFRPRRLLVPRAARLGDSAMRLLASSAPRTLRMGP